MTNPWPATAGAPGYDRLSAVAIATAALPAGLRRLCQGVLPRVPANPRTLIYPHSHSTAASFSRQREIQPPSPRKQEPGPSPHGGEGPGGEARPVPLPQRGGHRGPVSRPSHAHTRLLSHPPPTKCILPSKYRPARGLAPPRTRASPFTTPLAPRRLVIAAQAAIQPSGRIPCRGVPCGRPRRAYSPSPHGGEGAGG